MRRKYLSNRDKEEKRLELDKTNKMAANIKL
jgi:hypothetical protein